jgi:hypothetical protein
MDGHLGRAHNALGQRGVIATMNKIIGEVYERNAARHDPVLGDDATTFGIMTSRNIANLAVQRLKDLPGVRARLVDTALEVLCDGYVLRQYKLPGVTCNVSVDAMSWEDSEAKLDGAIENSAAGQLALDADMEAGLEAFGAVVPVMRHLRLAHAGDLETGECVIYLGIPRDNRDGGRPWFDVAVIYGDPDGSGEQSRRPRGPHDPAQPAGPSYDELPLPDVGLAPRPAARPKIQPDVGHGPGQKR